MIDPVLPGATVGILGGGQLGRMFAVEARRLGYFVHVFSPGHTSPTGQIADLQIDASLDDLDRVAEFARGVDVVTFEFENIPHHAAETANQYAPVRPRGHVLHTVQNRAREKQFLTDQGIPCAPYRVVRSPDELRTALAELKTPAILKTAAWGYDGKGQRRIENVTDADSVWTEFEAESVLEAVVPFDCELSAIIARGVSGEIAWYGPIRNDHDRHILDVSRMPVDVPTEARTEIETIARTIVEALDVVGLICIEFFLTTAGKVLVNEIAPRPHNSGHLTIDSCVTCQFEQQLRAVCGLPLGATTQIRPAAMANLLGDLWQPAAPNWLQMLQDNDVKLHLYGKTDARPGRKMGHLTALGETADDAADRVLAARDRLASRIDSPISGRVADS